MLWDDVVLYRIGLGIGFASFWFATPELLGEVNLIRLDGYFNRLLRRVRPAMRLIDISLYLVTVVVVSLGVSAIAWSLTFGSIRPYVATLAIAVGACLVGSIVVSLIAGVLAATAELLAQRGSYRRRALYFGALLFALSWLLQFVATYAP